jgi:transcriptional regulator MraZ
MDEKPNTGNAVEAPRGIYPARVDEKGRLKLPAPFQQYLGSLGEQKVFITSFDVHTARIYPISVWRDNENFFDDFAEDPETAEDVAFMANDLGADSELDGQGRLLVPQELRRSLGIENQPVWLDCYKGRINVYSKQVYEERKSRASQGLAEKVRALEKKGLK